MRDDPIEVPGVVGEFLLYCAALVLLAWPVLLIFNTWHGRPVRFEPIEQQMLATLTILTVTFGVAVMVLWAAEDKGYVRVGR